MMSPSSSHCFKQYRPCEASAADLAAARTSYLRTAVTTTTSTAYFVWDFGVKPVIARRGTEHGSGLGAQRWVVERAFAHLHWFRHLRIRWEIRDDIHEAFLTLGCALICWRRLVSLL